SLTLRPEFEYGIFVIEGDAIIDSQRSHHNELIYLGQGLSQVSLQLSANSHILLLGGEPLNESVLMWWNFIGRTKAEITAAVAEWNQG
ncbi:pirin-like C-terminal cupin domain-containing protein, partial [Escherichia coli]